MLPKTDSSPLDPDTGVHTQIMQPSISNSEAFWYNSDESVKGSKAQKLLKNVDSATSLRTSQREESSRNEVNDNARKKEKELVDSNKLV